MEDPIVIEAREYVRDRLYGEGTGHDWWHIHRVTAMAERIAEQERADRFIVVTAALFHDLADDKLVSSKEAVLEEIKQWLDARNVRVDKRDHILDIIATMSFRGGHGQPMKSLEGQIVQDADRLDALGAIGIARTFAYAGSKGHILHDPDIAPRLSMTETQYRNDASTAINHFYEKLLKLQARMNTMYAKQLAAERQAFMEAYLAQFHGEWRADR